MKLGYMTLLPLVFGMSLVCTAPVQAQELIERTFTGISAQTNPAIAKKEIVEKGQVKVLEDVIEEIIGAASMKKNKARIQKEFLKESSRFIPFSKQGELAEKDDKTEMTVSFSISLSDVRAQLITAGLLGERETVPTIIPLVVFKDRIKKHGYHWWSAEKPSMAMEKLASTVENQIFAKAFDEGFFVARPMAQKFYQFATIGAQTEFLTAATEMKLAKQYGAGLILRGAVELDQVSGEPPKVQMRFEVRSPGSNKPVAEVSKKFPVTYGVMESIPEAVWVEDGGALLHDLFTQLNSTWIKSGFSQGSVLLELTKWILPSDQEKFREGVKNAIPQVKSVQTRRLNRSGIEYEVETSLSAADLAERLKKLKISGRPLVLQEIKSSSGAQNQDAKITLEW